MKIQVGLVIMMLVCAGVMGQEDDADPKDPICEDKPDNTIVNNTHICCDTYAIDVKEDSGNKKCCINDESRFYNPQNQVCCFNGAVTATDPSKTECCGKLLAGTSELFNPETHICCRADKTFQLVTKTEADAENDDCCYDQRINSKKQMCCNRSKGQKVVVTKKDENDDKCCGDTTFNYSSEVCCKKTMTVADTKENCK